MSIKKPKTSGFTLLEILLVVGIIAILAAIVIIAINPSRQLATVRNTQRKFDLKQIDSAIQQYYIDNNVYPDTIPTELNEICNTGTATSTAAFPPGYCDDLVDLTMLVPTYFVAVPADPLADTVSLIPTAYAAENGTSYYVSREGNRSIILVASLTEDVGDGFMDIAIGTTTVNIIEENPPSASTYTVTYDGNGNDAGTVPTDNNTYEENATVIVLDNNNPSPLTKIGHTFAGWNTLANGNGVNYATSSTLIMGTSSVTLYAKWNVYVSPLNTPYVWVANYNLNTVSKIDSSTNLVVDTITVGSNPWGLAVGADGYVWVVNYISNNISKIDSSTNLVVDTITVGSGPRGVAVDANGNIWVANISSNSVSKINGSTNLVVDTITVGSSPIGVAVDADGYVWVINANSSSVSKIDSSTSLVVDTITVGFGPIAVAVDDDGYVWVSNSNSGTISKIDSSTSLVVDTITVGSDPRGVAVDADGYVWVANRGSSTVSKVDGSTNVVVNTITVGSSPHGVAVDADGYVWVSNTTSNTISKIDSLTNVVVDTISVGSVPYSLGDLTGFALQYFVLGRR